MPMPRADRKNENDDNELNNPRSRSSEPLSLHEYRQKYLVTLNNLNTVQQERDTFKAQVEENTAALVQLTTIQHEFQATQAAMLEWQDKANSHYQLFLDEKTQHEHTLSLYTAEQSKARDLFAQYEAADAERLRYVTLYEETQAELKFERRSKAGIKGWETRRKRENERLKQEIQEMTNLLRDSLERGDTAIESLQAAADRMDRIQSLVNSVDDDETDNPVGMLTKFKRIWLAIREILGE